MNAADNNTGVGIGALNAITSADNNVAIGKDAGGALTTGAQNVAIGRDAMLTASTNASYSTAIGYYSMRDGTGGFGNTGIGYHTLRDVTGRDNIAIGINSGRNITDGSGNIFIGTYLDADNSTDSRKLKIAGYDGTTRTTWLSGDSSGNLTTIGDVTLANDKKVIFGDAGEHIVGDGTNLNIVSSNVLTLNSNAGGGGGIYLKASGTTFGTLESSSGIILRSTASNADIKFRGNDGGSAITALTLDMSEAGAATFNSTVTTTQLNVNTAQGSIKIQNGFSGIDFARSGSNYIRATGSSGNFVFITGAANFSYKRQTIGNSGDIIFYEDTGTTGKFIWDASEERIGIGTTSPSQPLHVIGNILGTGNIEAANFKQEGTNFTGSLLIGHSTTGTLNAATYNTGVGLGVLDALTSGDSNTALGHNALSTNTVGGGNTAIGRDALLSNNNGGDLTAVGFQALRLNSGSNSTAVGKNALVSNSTGSRNTALGVTALGSVAAGDGNIGIGYTSGNNITSGSGNVVIGVADVASATGDKQFKISDGEDGSVVWLTGDSSGNLTTVGDVTLANNKKVIFGDERIIQFKNLTYFDLNN